MLWSTRRKHTGITVEARTTHGSQPDNTSASNIPAQAHPAGLSKLSILHLVVRLAAPNNQYNEHCLPVIGKRDLTICSYFKDPSLTVPAEINLFEGGGTTRGFLRALRSAFDSRSFDVVHVHGPQTGLLLMVSSLLARRSMASAVYTVQNSFRNYSLRNQILLFPIFAVFPRIVLCSQSVLESLPRVLRSLGRSKINIVPNSVDTDRVDRVLNELDGSRNGSFTAISVARLVEIKDPVGLMEAFGKAQLDDAKLIFVGDGELGPRLSERAAQLGYADRITFKGMVPRDEVYRCTGAADVYLSTSRGEGLPVAVLEAMACGVPVILSDIPPHREIVRDVDFIPLVPPGDIEGFARELRRLRDASPEQRASIGRRCRQIVDERYSLWAMHRSYDKVYVDAANSMKGTN
jgi:glycosyltransferase involved in cell wall biosynthesis